MKRSMVLLTVLIILAGLAVIFCLPAQGIRSAQAAMLTPDTAIVVNTLEDELNNDGDCSLREAVEAANTNDAVDACPAGQAQTDTITFSVAGTITGGLSVTAGGPLVIDGGEGITTSGGGPVWRVEAGSDLTLQNLTVTNGSPGLINYGAVTLINSTYSGNSKRGCLAGGGIENYGTLNIIRSIFSGNSVLVGLPRRGHCDSVYGGGIYNKGTLNITNSTFTGNRASFYCSDWWNCPEALSAYGGGIYNSGSLRITDSTFSGNYALGKSYGDNGGSYGGGIYTSRGAGLTNTIVAHNNYGGDCYGIFTDHGYNLDSDGTCGLHTGNGSLPKTDPMLADLQDYGGPTWTQALLPGSPAIDAGDNAHCPDTDQRGVPRPIDGDGNGHAGCDMGAFEYRQEIFLFPVTQSSSGELGKNVNYFFQLDNWTRQTDTYSLALGPHAWQTTLSPDPVGPLPSGGSQVITVTVSIPAEAAWYQLDTVVITATSQNYPDLYSDFTQVTTQAYAPPQLIYTPPSLENTQYAGEITNQLLTISNGNAVTLTYEIAEEIPWLSVDPVSGEVPTNGSRGVTVTLDATNLQPGIYTAMLDVQSNDPSRLHNDVWVTLQVEPTVSMGWVEGYVTDLGNGGFLEATIIAQGQPYTVTSDAATGYYILWLEPGTYILQVYSPCYGIQTPEVLITAQQEAIQDFALQYECTDYYLPCIVK